MITQTWTRRASLLSLAALVTSLAGCSSAPIHYHTLVPIDGAAKSAPSSPYDVVIDRVTMPPQVDRAQMVIREGNSGLVILETEWWGANLTDELQNALENQLPQASESGPSSGSARKKLHLTLDVQRFDTVAGQYALIEATWRLRAREAGIQMTCHSKLNTPADNSIDALVRAHQDNVTKLASSIVAAGTRGVCP